MVDWSDVPQEHVVPRLSLVPLELRQALRQGRFNKATHEKWFDALPCFREIEVGGANPVRKATDASARIVFWNVERLRHMDDIAQTLKELAPDVMLLCEIDRGMARSGNSDRVVDIAAKLNVGYAYAVEFVELDLGDVQEKVTHAGELNSDGLHGAAILSEVVMQRPFLIRIDRRGDWFGLERHEPRVGGTIALGTKVDVAGVAVTMVNVHLESHDDPEARAQDMERLLIQVEAIAGHGPVILGGDFNTSTAAHLERAGTPDAWRAKIMAEPLRLLRPVRHEPLFQVAAEYGYEWQNCNVADFPTTRYPEGSKRLPAKLDWFFTRGLEAGAADIIPAIQENGAPSSDHECLVVSIRPRG
jgi:endonuclease/exonuclease/phosphatase family metal-dependent hydrolase